MLRLGYLALNNPIVVQEPISVEPPGCVGLRMVKESHDHGLFEIAKSMGEKAPSIPFGIVIGVHPMDYLVNAAKKAREDSFLLELDTRGLSLSTDLLHEIVRRVKGEGATLALRIKPDSLHDGEAKALRSEGLDVLHLDLLNDDGIAPKLIKRVSDGGAPTIMVSGRVGDFDGASRLLSSGASLLCFEGSDLEFVEWLASTMRQYEDIIGWYNAPKHICSGGDLRGLAFCCPPIKNCPVQGAIKKLGWTPNDFIKKKQELARGTPLQYGDGTCFGSLVWCCKISKPCFMRDAVLRDLKISAAEYMRLKKKLAEGLLS